MINKIVFLMLSIMSISCTSEPLICKEEGIILTNYSDGSGPPKTDLFIKFYLCDSILKNDTINMNIYKYAQHDIENSYISINLPPEYDLKKIERETIFYVDIWNNSQFGYLFLKLNDINFPVKREISFYNPQNYQRNIYFDLIDDDEVIEIEKNYALFKNSKNIIFYPKIYSNSYIKKNLKSFTKEQICNAIQKEISKENNINDLNNKEKEKSYWLSYCNEFNQSNYLEVNSDFQINFHETYLILDIKINDRLIKRVLKYHNHVGN